MQLKTNEEFKNLIPLLSAEEYGQLEQNILDEGCRDAIVVWNGVIVDGHNRYEICTKHSIVFQTEDMEFVDEQAARAWIIKNQFGRRNLSKYDRSILALKLKPVIAEQAKENQGVRTDISQKSVECLDTQKELAQIAGVSHDTISKVETIETKAPEMVREAARNNVVSINRAHNITKQVQGLPEEKQEETAEMLLRKEVDEEIKQINEWKRRQQWMSRVIGDVAFMTADEESVEIWFSDNDIEGIESKRDTLERAISKLQKLKELTKDSNKLRRVK